jgi:spore coat protein U-like protein
MKKISLLVAALFSGLASVPAQAATTTGTFNVDISLTSACEITTVPTVAFTYTSFQVGAAAAAVGAGSVRCTNTLPYSVALSPVSATDTTTNLAYTLTLGTAGGTGNGAGQAINVSGTMAGGQAGTCNSSLAACTNTPDASNLHTLTITY